MPIGRIGDFCSRCEERPADKGSQICRSCTFLLTSFGHRPEPENQTDQELFDQELHDLLDDQQ